MRPGSLVSPVTPRAAATFAQVAARTALLDAVRAEMAGVSDDGRMTVPQVDAVLIQLYGATADRVSDDLRTPYLVDDKLELSAWARDAVALALPDKILCRQDCAGLCPFSGKNLNDEPHEHDEEATDSRWSALDALRGKL